METPVVFNNRLEGLPSIGSTTNETASRSSREEDHRGLQDAVFDASMESMNTDTCTPSTIEKDEESRERKDSVMD